MEWGGMAPPWGAHWPKGGTLRGPPQEGDSAVPSQDILTLHLVAPGYER